MRRNPLYILTGLVVFLLSCGQQDQQQTFENKYLSRTISLLMLIILLWACGNKKKEQSSTTETKKLSIERPPGGWTVERINQWYDHQEWIVG